MAASIDITRTKGSTAPMTFTITDELGGVQSIANWSDFDLVVYVSPAKEYSRTVTFSDTGGGTFTEDVRVIVGDSELPTTLNRGTLVGSAAITVRSTGKPSPIDTYRMYVNNSRNARVDFSLPAGRSKSDIEEISWAVEEGTNIALGTQTLDARNITEIQLATSDRTGKGLIRCKATLENGEVLTEYFIVEVVDPYL